MKPLKTIRLVPVMALALAAAGCNEESPEAGAATATVGLQAQAPEGQWFEGDAHVHTDHSSDGSLPRQTSDDHLPGNVSVADQIQYAELQGLDFLPLTDHRTYGHHYNPQWASEKLLLIPGEEANGRPHALILGAVDMLVEGAQPPGDPGYRYLQQQVWEAHAQGAVYGAAHPERDWSEDWPDERNLFDFNVGDLTGGFSELGGTLLARANTVGLDFIEVWNRAQWPDRALEYAEKLLNRGYRFGFIGGSDNHFRETRGLQGPGEPRTGVFADGQLSERSLLDAVRAGRTRVRNHPTAPEIDFHADFTGTGQFPAMAGDEVFVAEGTPGQLRIRVQNGAGNTLLVYQAPGREAGPIAEFTVLPHELDATFTVDVRSPGEPTWYRAELRGRGLIDSARGVDFEELTVGHVERQIQGNQLSALASPIFVSEKPVEARPVIPVPQDSGVDEGAVHAVGEAGGFAGFPDVAFSRGRTHVVAESHKAGTTRITYRQQRGGGAGPWSEPRDLAPDSDSARFPRIVAQGEDVWVVWQDERAGQVPRRPALYLRHSPDRGDTWSDEQRVRAVEGRVSHPALAVTPQGHPVVAWAEIGANRPFDVWVKVLGVDDAPQNLSGPGKVFHPQRSPDPRSALWPTSVHPTVAVAPDGAIAVAWQDNREDPDPLFTGGPAQPPYTEPAHGTATDIWNIHVRERPSPTANWSEPEVFGAAERLDGHPDLAWGADGTLVVAWNSREREASGVNFDIRAVQRTPGEDWGAPQVIAPAPEFTGQRPRLGTDEDGAVRVAWHDTRSEDWRWRVMTARLDAGRWGDTTLFPAPGNNTWPAVGNGRIAFASTRNAQRLQRDKTQEIFVINPE